MNCKNCGNTSAWHLYYTADHALCDACGLEGGGPGVPDVFLPRSGMTFDALCDRMGRPIAIQSKRHKQQVMDQLGVRECPERLEPKTWIEGTRAYRNQQFDKDRPMIQKLHREYQERARHKR